MFDMCVRLLAQCMRHFRAQPNHIRLNELTSLGALPFSDQVPVFGRSGVHNYEVESQEEMSFEQSNVSRAHALLQSQAQGRSRSKASPDEV